MRATLSLFRQDPAAPAMIRALLSCLAVGFLFRIVPDISRGIEVLDIENLPGGFVYLYMVLTGLIVIMVISGNSWTRSSQLALGLPVGTRTVWSVRVLSLVAIGLISAAALGASTGITVDFAQGTLVFNSVVLLTALRAAVTAVLVTFLFQLPLSARARIPITAPYVVYMIFIGLITIVVSAVSPTSVAGTLVLLLITLPLGAWLAVRVPPTFSVGPTVEESLSPVAITPEEIEPMEQVGWDIENGKRPKLLLHRVLFRGLKPNVLIWFLLAIIGASATVATLEFLKGTNAFMPLFFIVIYHLPLVQGVLDGMKPFDPLPISRNLLWAHTAGPIAVAAALGLAIAFSIFMINPESFVQIHVNNDQVQVPWDYWEISADGHVPAVTAAWGESFTPKAHPLWRGRTIALYDPYESGPESSPRFVEFQVHRAAQAVYGIPVPSGLSGNGRESRAKVGDGAGPGELILDETRGLVSEDRSRTAAIALMVLSVLITGMMLPTLLQHGPWVHRKIFKRASIGFMVLLVAAAIGVSLARLLGFTQVWYIGVLLSMGIRFLAHALPLPTIILWILCVTFWSGAYLLVGRVFKMVEFPKEKSMNRFAEEY